MTTPYIDRTFGPIAPIDPPHPEETRRWEIIKRVRGEILAHYDETDTLRSQWQREKMDILIHQKRRYVIALIHSIRGIRQILDSDTWSSREERSATVYYVYASRLPAPFSEIDHRSKIPTVPLHRS